MSKHFRNNITFSAFVFFPTITVHVRHIVLLHLLHCSQLVSFFTANDFPVSFFLSTLLVILDNFRASFFQPALLFTFNVFSTCVFFIVDIFLTNTICHRRSCGDAMYHRCSSEYYLSPTFLQLLLFTSTFHQRGLLWLIFYRQPFQSGTIVHC